MSVRSRWTIVVSIALALPTIASIMAQDVKKAETVTITVQNTAVVIQDAKPAEKKPIAKPDDERKDIIAKTFRVIERAVVPPRAVAAQRVMIMQRAQAAVRIDNANMANADPDLDPMAAQWLAQFTPMVKTELHFLLNVSQANPEQRKSISAGRNKAAKQSAKLYAQSQQRTGRFQNTSTYPQPRNLVQESLMTLATPILSAEQIERYKVEVQKREDDHKSLAIKNIVARMDQDLVLSPEQREKLEVVLSKNWNATWCQSLETFMYGDQFFPAIPDNLITPVLNDQQSKVWRGTQKNNGQVFGGFFQVLEADDAFPEDEEPPAEPKKEEAVKAVEGRPMLKNVRVFVKAAGNAEAKEEIKVDANKKDTPKPTEKAADKPADTPKPKTF